ncbi:hypothetical protein [Cryptosporangium sp. NPDC048952]|uniref:hypothetical protein n=1 Tax=Cryptosporangium sp. NPDC048952 TaxID=3363961 RepID=UPI0037197C4B
MTHAPDQRPPRSLLGVRGARFVLALCAALLAAVGLGGAAAPGAATSVGYGATPVPATARAAGHGAVSGAANRVRPNGQHENSKPASAAVHRGQPDLLPVAIAVARFGLIEPILPAGPALAGAPSRAPPAPAGLPDTRAPPSSGRI